MKRNILLAVAPVGKVPGVPEGNPARPDEVAREAVACARAGAAMVHLHVRDAGGVQTSSLADYSRTLDLIRAESDIIIQGSTGGLSDLSLEERCVSLDEPRTQVASLNMGSTNVGDTVYVNTLNDIRYWARRMRDAAVAPEMEIFSLGMFGAVDALAAEGLVAEAPEHRNYNFALGFDGALPADMESLLALKARLPGPLGFGVLHEGFDGFGFLAGALAAGATGIRVGFEDGWTTAPGRRARSNRELVDQAVELLDRLGYGVMSIDEAASRLGVRK